MVRKTKIVDNFTSEIPEFLDARSLFLSGGSTPRDYLETCISNISSSEETVRAFSHYDLAKARTAADASTLRYRDGCPQSPIDGMPVGIKDIIDTFDMPTQMNNRMYDGYMARADAACVRAVREGGAVIVGKTVTTEFAIGRSGPTVNPHNPLHTPGGSSSGAAAGTASGMFAASFGTQTQGSIIRPASFNGVVGFKPTLNALSTDGVHPLSRTHDHLGVLGQSVGTAWAFARWVGEIAPGQDTNGLGGPLASELDHVPVKRVAVPRTAGLDELDDNSRAAFEAQLDQFRAAGITVVDSFDDPYLADLARRLDHIVDISLRMVAFDMRWPYRTYVERYPDEMGPRLHDLVKLGHEVTLDEYRLMRSERDDLRQRVQELSRSYDAVVLPSSSGPAPEGFEFTGARTLLLYWSFLGFPVFGLPLMEVDGMPFGLQLAGFRGRDFELAQHANWMMRQFG
ncbi:amidase [Hoeflea sp. YIM 152468]|uniref:amidase n=1 Tax=Hoeflea sp. YIM 152468 TaxID=3031759 RepID=UPI0023DA8803|nr:amidase [Hoeflea sp. YIM 152468]MDF1608684.1 amidase [Hoeflea sp. YIM 152468]